MRSWTGRRPAIASARHPALLAALSYVILALVILGPSIRPGRTVVPADLLGPLPPYQHLTIDRAQNADVSDAAYQFYPWLKQVGTSMRHNTLPEWNPTILGGVRVTPNGYVSPYYPPTWLARFLDAFDTYNLFVLVHLVVAALGVYVLSRVLGARPLAAWVAGVLALTADFWVHWSLHLVHIAAFALLPWLLAAAHVAVTRPRLRSVAALALAVGLALIGGNPQYVYFGFLAAGGYAALRIGRDRLLDGGPVVRPALALAAGFALGAALSAVVLLPSLTLRPDIVRSKEGPEAMAGTVLPRSEAIRLLVPDAIGNPPDKINTAPSPEAQLDSPFVGVTAILLVGAVLFAPRSRLLLLAGAAVVLILVFASPPNRLLYDILPGYNGFRGAGRWFSVLPVFVLPAAALGFDAILAGDPRSRIGLLATAALAALAVVTWVVVRHNPAGVPNAYFVHRALWALGIVAVVAAAAVVVRRYPAVTIALVCACAVAEVLVHTPRWYPSVREATAYPPVAVAATARADGGRLVHVAPGDRSNFSSFGPDTPMVYGLSDVQGWTTFFPKRVDRYLRMVDDYGLYAVLDSLAPPLADPNQVQSPLLTALNARTVVSSVTIDGHGLSPAGVEPFTYTRPALGGAWLVPHASATTEAAMWGGIARPDWAPGDVAYVHGLPHDVAGTGGTVRGGRKGTDGERWAVDSNQGGFLVVSAGYDPGWHANVDGKDAQVFETDGMLRGVSVSPGHHVVDFHFTNPDESRGRLITLIAAIVVLGLAVAPRRAATGRSGSPAHAR